MLACGVCGSDVLPWYVARKLPAVLGHEPAGEVLRDRRRASRSSRPATGLRSTTTRRAASAGAAGGATRRCASASAPSGSIPAASPSWCGSRPSWWTSCCRWTAWTRRSPRSSSRSPASCAPRTAPACAPATACLSWAPAPSGLLHVAAAHARAVDAVWVREPREDRRALAEAWGAEHHGNEHVDVAIVCTPKPDAIAAAAEALAPGGELCLYAPPEPATELPIDGRARLRRRADDHRQLLRRCRATCAPRATWSRRAAWTWRPWSPTAWGSTRPGGRSSSSAAARRSRRSSCREGGAPPRAGRPAGRRGARARGRGGRRASRRPPRAGPT